MSIKNRNRVAGVPEGAYLVFNQMIFPINKPITHIGRNPDNDLVIQSSSVSRFHAQIHVEMDTFVLLDLNSHNGVLVNKKNVKRTTLKSGLVLYFGDVMVVFVQEDKHVTDSLQKDTGELKLKK